MQKNKVLRESTHLAGILNLMWNVNFGVYGFSWPQGVKNQG